MLERAVSMFGSMDSPNPSQRPSSVRTVPGSNQSHADSFVLSLLSLPDSSPIFGCSSFDGVLDKALASVSCDELLRDHLVDRTLKFASVLIDSTKRCFRKRACAHNSTSWFLPSELTVKVFSMLDTKSLMQAAACCTMFNKCAMDPLCYSHIDLEMSAKYAGDEVVNTMIHRGGKELRSLKLVRAARSTQATTIVFRTSCLKPLAYNYGSIGLQLRSLRLYNLSPLSDRYSLREALSVCSNITELKIVGLPNPSEELFKSLAGKCRLLEHLLLENYRYPCPKMGSSLVEFVISCPNLTSLTLLRFGLTDEMAQILAKSCRKVMYLNLSSSSTIQGRFLRYLALSCQERPLKTLILRNCPQLEERETLELCDSLLTGNCKPIQHIDVSSNYGLALDEGCMCRNPRLPLERLREERSDLTFVAEFPIRSSAKCHRVCDKEDLRLIEKMEAKNLRVVEDEDDIMDYSPGYEFDYDDDEEGDDEDEDEYEYDVSHSEEEDMDFYDDY